MVYVSSIAGFRLQSEQKRKQIMFYLINVIFTVV